MTKANPPADSLFRASLIVGGQIRGAEPRLFLIYPEGNFIEAGEDNPFFQIGETKYGRPIIVRSYDPAMSFEDAVKLLCVSFDSTIRANAGVDLPIDLKVHERDDFTAVRERRFERNDPYFESVADGWAGGAGDRAGRTARFSFLTSARAFAGKRGPKGICNLPGLVAPAVREGEERPELGVPSIWRPRGFPLNHTKA